MSKMGDIEIKNISGLDEGIRLSSTRYTDFHFPRHFHDHYTILGVWKGVNQGFTENEHYLIGPGSLLIINPSDLHAGNSHENRYLHFHSITFGPEYLKTWAQQSDFYFSEDLLFQKSPVSDPIAYQLFLKTAIGPNNIRKSSFNHLLEYLIGKYSHKELRINPTRFPAAIEFMHRNFHQSLTLEDIAATGGMSKYHFLRCFKSQYGLTPLQYLRNLRVEKAKQIISRCSISETAARVGFYDQSHFVKNFKKIQGTTPILFKSSWS